MSTPGIDGTRPRSMRRFVAALFAIGSVASPWAHADSFIQIGAHIDGIDRLIIRGETLRWHHFEYAAPGRHAGSNSPTIIDTEQFHTEWIPEWPEGVPSEIRSEAFSSAFSAPTPVLPAEATRWYLTKLAGPGEVHIREQPSAANQFRLVVEFDDGGPPGSSFYTVRLSPAQRIVIDLKPFARSNAVTPGTTSVIQVAVMSNLLLEGFDATLLDPATVEFGPRRVGPIDFTLRDINKDGLQDAVLSFRVDQTGISCGDSQVTMTASTTAGTAVEGQDVLRTVNCQ